jgi:hypothetical protein
MTAAAKSVFAIACAIGAIVVVVAVRPDEAAGPCVVMQRMTNMPGIPEASGLAVSRRTAGILWSHNDSGNTATLFALDFAGAERGRVRVPIRTRDWEDVSAGGCPAGACLYIADIGDNRMRRDRVQIYRLPEPTPGDAETAATEVFDAVYADGPHNAEALFVLGQALFIVTRDRNGAVYRATMPRSPGSDLTFQRTGDLGLTVVTDAEASPDEASVVVRTSKEALIYRAADLARGGSMQPALRIPLAGLNEPQGEGGALGADGMLYLVSEGRPWNRAGRFISLRCNLR